MSRLKQKLVGTVWFIFVLVFVSIMFTLAFFLTGYVYATLGIYPPLLLAQLVNSLLGLLLTGTLVGTAATFARSRGWMPEMKPFGPIIQALEKIAQGDFSIRLSDELEQHQIAAELTHTVNKMALQLGQMENMRQEFISNVSHEIQSPLTSIRGFAQALENDQLSAEERHHYLSIIEAESTRLSRITDDLLKLAALEAEQPRFAPQLYRLDKQIRDVILACEPQWTNKKIDMDVSLEEVEIIADEDLLSQVWINLIDNSIKYTYESGRVCIKLFRQNDQVKIQITDTGIGISEQDQARVFERFYKVDRSRTHSNGGSGLGLAIAKKIVEMHGGALGVESELGVGTSFTVSVPAKP